MFTDILFTIDSLTGISFRRAGRRRAGDVVGEASWASSVINLVNTSEWNRAIYGNFSEI